MTTPHVVETETVWKVCHNHIAMSLEEYDPFELQDILYRHKESALKATGRHLRKRAKEGHAEVGHRPPWGPRIDDDDWKRKNGEPSWEWRLHWWKVERREDDVLVKATYDYRVLVERSARTYTEIDGKREAVGWHRRPVVVEDWAPFVAYDSHLDEIQEHTRDGRILRGWPVEICEVTLEWGDKL